MSQTLGAMPKEDPSYLGHGRVLAWIWEMLHPFSWRLLVLLWCPLAWAVGLSLSSYTLQVMVSRISEKQPSLLWPMICFVGIRVILMATFRLYDWAISITMIPALRRSIGERILGKILSKKYVYFQENPAGNLVTKTNDLMRNVPNLIETTALELMGNLLALGVAIFTLNSVEPIFGILMALWAASVLIISWFSSRYFLKLSRGLSEQNTQLSGTIMDILKNILSVRLFSNHRHEDVYLSDTMDNLVHKEQKMEGDFLRLRSLTSVVSLLILGANGWFLCQGYGAGTVDAGGFALVLMVNRSVMDFLWKFDQVFSNISEYYGSISQALSTLLGGESIEKEKNLGDLRITEGKITLSQVCFAYPGRPPLFQNLSLEIAGGEKVGIVGYSGGGKTSLVHLLLRLYDISSGSICIDGQDISHLSMESLYHHITLVPQETSLFARSLRDNLMYANPDLTPEELEVALRAACAQDFIAGLTQGVDTLMGAQGVGLSGGQRQRMGLARAMVRRSPIVILDESTSQLDAVTESHIQDHLWRFFEKKTVLIIAHRLSTLKRMDRILVFDQGRMVEEGSHGNLLKQKGIYYTMWNLQEKGEGSLGEGK